MSNPSKTTGRKAVNKNAAEPLAVLSKAFDGVALKAPKKRGANPTLVRDTVSGALNTYVGWINHAGRVADGTFQVQFNVPGDGWSSRWPEWAYEIALAGLTSQKRVWVISTGLPFGPNLLQVLLLNQDV